MRRSVSKRLIRQVATNFVDKLLLFLGIAFFLIQMVLFMLTLHFFYVGFAFVVIVLLFIYFYGKEADVKLVESLYMALASNPNLTLNQLVEECYMPHRKPTNNENARQTQRDEGEFKVRELLKKMIDIEFFLPGTTYDEVAERLRFPGSILHQEVKSDYSSLLQQAPLAPSTAPLPPAPPVPQDALTPQASSPAPQQKPQSLTEFKYCGECGAKNKRANKFCNQCGTVFEE